MTSRFYQYCKSNIKQKKIQEVSIKTAFTFLAEGKHIVSFVGASAYTDAEIEEIYNQYKDTCAGYESFIVGYTQTVSCDQYIYVYIASTTNATTGDYVENTFVLSKEDGTFKVDGKTDGAKAYLQQAPTKMAQ